MKLSTLVWILLCAAAAAALSLRLGGRIGLTGCLWLVSSILLLPSAVNSRPRLSSYWSYVLFLALAWLGLVWLDGALRVESIQSSVQLSVPLLAFVVARNQSERLENAHVPLAPLAAAASCILSVMLVAVVTGSSILNRRPAAATMVFLAACFLGLASTGERKGWLGAVAAFGYCFLTGSRTATFSILMLAALVPLRRRTWLVRGMVLVGIAALAVLTFQARTFQERFFKLGGGGLEEVLAGRIDSSGRFGLWPPLYEDATENPIVGHGSGSSQAASRALTGGVLEHPHNDYLKVFYEFGLVGSVLFWLYYVAAWLTAASHTYAKGGPRGEASAQLYLVLTGFFLISFTDNTVLYTASFMLPVFCIIGIAEGQWARQKFSNGVRAHPDADTPGTLRLRCPGR
jgi:O-antigen ligase